MPGPKSTKMTSIPDSMLPTDKCPGPFLSFPFNYDQYGPASLLPCSIHPQLPFAFSSTHILV